MKKNILFLGGDGKRLDALKAMLCTQSDTWNMEFIDNDPDALLSLEHNRYDVVVADLEMSDRSGTEIIDLIKQYRPDAQVIIIAAKPDCRIAVECIRHGAVNYIAKPLDENKIITTIHSALRDQLSKTQKIKPFITELSASAKHGIAGYKILQTIDEGSMGIIFLAEKRIRGKNWKIALKVIKIAFEIGENEQLVRWERFMREARIAANINHPNIIKLVEFGFDKDEQIPFIAMEYIDGPSLQQIIREKVNLSFREKIRIISQTASALQAIHDHNILHRDIKPANILLQLDNDYNAILTDFGIARLPGSELTTTLVLVGSPAYFSPEILISPDIDERSDIFSLGVVAYELFLLTKPFEADNFVELSQKIRCENPILPQEIDDEFPSELQRIIMKMIEKNPENRYHAVAEVAEDLDRIIRG